MEEELSDSGGLEQFLQENDPEKFRYAFKTKEVTKVKHLQLVSEGMLKESFQRCLVLKDPDYRQVLPAIMPSQSTSQQKILLQSSQRQRRRLSLFPCPV